MKQAVVVGGTLGLGTAIVFGAAALASVLFPNGGTVSGSWAMDKGVERGVVFAPAPMPAPDLSGIGTDDTTVDGKGVTVGPSQP